MRRFGYPFLALAAAVVMLAAAVGPATASPAANSSVFLLRVWNDDSDSNLSTFDNYPAEVWIDEEVLNGDGFGGEFANLDMWRLSTDDTAPAEFANGDAFKVGATLNISGTGNGEAGLMCTPWWSNSDGRFNVRTSDGEIACFGGRLPFFSFTATYGLHYVKGDDIFLEMIYRPMALTQAFPGNMTYNLTYGGMSYTSGPLNFDEGNPAEDPPHGLWGILNTAEVGGHQQALIVVGDPTNGLKSDWTNIQYTGDLATPAEPASWGRVKSLYR